MRQDLFAPHFFFPSSTMNNTVPNLQTLQNVDDAVADLLSLEHLWLSHTDTSLHTYPPLTGLHHPMAALYKLKIDSCWGKDHTMPYSPGTDPDFDLYLDDMVCTYFQWDVGHGFWSENYEDGILQYRRYESTEHRQDVLAISLAHQRIMKLFTIMHPQHTSYPRGSDTLFDDIMQDMFSRYGSKIFVSTGFWYQSTHFYRFCEHQEPTWDGRHYLIGAHVEQQRRGMLHAHTLVTPIPTDTSTTITE
jgi:hypothetical protein